MMIVTVAKIAPINKTLGTTRHHTRNADIALERCVRTIWGQSYQYWPDNTRNSDCDPDRRRFGWVERRGESGIHQSPPLLFEFEEQR